MKQNNEYEAVDKTEESRWDAEDACSEVWKKSFERVCGKGQDAVAFLENMRLALDQAAQLIADDRAPTLNDLMTRKLMAVLSTSFCYDFTLYEWNGHEMTEESMTGELDCAAQASWIVDALEGFLEAAATRAKVLGSDTYTAWRKALVDLNYRFDRFYEGAEEKAVKAFLSDIQAAAQNLWVDATIQKRLSQSVPSTRGIKGKKGKKSNAGVGRG